jgi:uncharacterized protein (DUF58 family)
MALTARAALVTLAGIVPLVLAPGLLTLLCWLLVLAVLIGVDLALAGSPRALRILREPVPTVRLGEEVRAALVVGNAGQQRRVVTTLRPTRRGDRRTERVTVRSLGPLGVAARQASSPAPGAVRVLPAFAARRHLPGKLARLRELDGLVSLNVRGQGTEFDSLRDYVDGDDVRSIDWRATARRHAGQPAVSPVVRTWRPERDRRLLLVLDVSRTAAARVGDAPRLDAAMDAALLLAALAARAGDRVDLLAMDRRVRARVEGVGRSSLLPALVSAMAPLEADLVEADWAAVSAAVLRQLSRRALVVLLTAVDSAAVADELLPVLPVLTARHQVVVASVTDPGVDAMAGARGDAYAVYGAAAAQRAVLERTAVTAELERFGVEVVEGSPEQLPPRLADRYLALKAAGRL